MFNRVKALFQNPKTGWDPIPVQYAREYSEMSYNAIDYGIISEVEGYTNGVQNKKLIDLGAGPGQYAIEFARRGAEVTWSDISKNYMDIASEKAARESLSLNFELTYMDNAEGNFDILFNRVCWYYCKDDERFLKKVYSLVKKGGYGYLILHDEGLLARMKDAGLLRKLFVLFSFHLNDKTGIKIGHPVPSFRKIKRMFSKYTFLNIRIEKRGVDTVHILFQK